MVLTTPNPYTPLVPILKKFRLPIAINYAMAFPPANYTKPIGHITDMSLTFPNWATTAVTCLFCSWETGLSNLCVPALIAQFRILTILDRGRARLDFISFNMWHGVTTTDTDPVPTKVLLIEPFCCLLSSIICPYLVAVLVKLHLQPNYRKCHAKLSQSGQPTLTKHSTLPQPTVTFDGC